MGAVLGSRGERLSTIPLLRCHVCSIDLTFERWPVPLTSCPACHVKKLIVCGICLDCNPENIVDRCGCKTGKPVYCERRGYGLFEVQR